MNDAEIRAWIVEYSEPETHGYRSNRRATYVCVSATRAIEMALEDHPDATVWSAKHVGRVDRTDSE